MNSATPLLEVRAVTKRYGTVVANDNVHLRLHQGEVHALLEAPGAAHALPVQGFFAAVRAGAGTP